MVLNIWVKYMNKNTNKLEKIVIILLFIIIIAIGAYFNIGEENQTGNNVEYNKISYEISNIPEYSGEIYVDINNKNMIQVLFQEDIYIIDVIAALVMSSIAFLIPYIFYKKAKEDNDKFDLIIEKFLTNEEDKEKGNSSGSETLSELSFHIPKDTDDAI